ncbi:MAG TPA: phage tail tube protein [Actinomycetota bacterium]|nr:phage tail tube protein [Actinomycetota bacterium]
MTVVPVLVSNKFFYSLAKQSAWGSAAANPDYQIPVYDGTNLAPTQDRADLELISGQAFLPGQYITGAGGGGLVNFAAHPDSNGRIFAAHFGTASDTVTGAGDPRSHTFARKDTPLPHTLWVGAPLSPSTTQYDRFEDAVCNQLDIIYTAGQFLQIGATFLAARTVGNATTPTPTTTITIPSAGVFGHTWARAVLKIDPATTPATTAITYLTDFTITSAYANASFPKTQNVTGDFYSSGLYTLNFTASGLMQNRDFHNLTFYGSAAPGANTALSTTTVAGALDFTIDQEPTSANRTLQIQIPYIQFSIDGAATPSASADPVTVAIKGTLQVPASGEPITVVQKTSVATTYS